MNPGVRQLVVAFLRRWQVSVALARGAAEAHPWFEDAPESAILNVALLDAQHLYWPDLDVDLAVESIEHPERFPLIPVAPNGT